VWLSPFGVKNPSCGRCGERMGVRYYRAHGTLVPEYHCAREAIEHARPPCARIVGHAVDRAVGELLVENVSPLALEAALGIEAELAARAAEADWNHKLRALAEGEAEDLADLAHGGTGAWHRHRSSNG
jgi:hypothetical protein